MRVLLIAVEIFLHRDTFTVFNLISEILSISRRDPFPVILVQDTSKTLSLIPDILRISVSPPSVRFRHPDRFSTSRFGREFTPSSTPTPVMLESDKSNSLRLLLDLFNISIIRLYITNSNRP